MPLIIKRFFKKIITFYLILSLIFFSPFSFSALPAVVGAGKAILGGAIVYGLTSPTGKKIMKKIGDSILGGDSDYEDDDDGYRFVLVGSKYCFDSGKNGNYIYCADNVSQAKAVYGAFLDDENNTTYKNYDSDYCKYNESHTIIICYAVHDDGKDRISHQALCRSENKCKNEKITNEKLYEEIKKLAEKGDEDAQKVKKDIDDEIERRKKDDDDTSEKKDDDDTSDDDDSTKKKDDDDDDTSDDKCTNDDTSDDDDTCKKDDDTSEKNDDDDEKCSTSAFHKKVCDWIDWTYEETDKAKKKIADFLNDDEIDKIDKEKLNHLVNEEDVTLKTYNFDIADACPTPKKVTSSLFGRTIEIEVFNFEGICRYAGLIEFALETTSTIIAINIIAGRKAD